MFKKLLSSLSTMVLTYNPFSMFFSKTKSNTHQSAGTSGHTAQDRGSTLQSRASHNTAAPMGCGGQAVPIGTVKQEFQGTTVFMRPVTAINTTASFNNNKNSWNIGTNVQSRTITANTRRPSGNPPSASPRAAPGEPEISVTTGDAVVQNIEGNRHYNGAVVYQNTAQSLQNNTNSFSSGYSSVKGRGPSTGSGNDGNVIQDFTNEVHFKEHVHSLQMTNSFNNNKNSWNSEANVDSRDISVTQNPDGSFSYSSRSPEDATQAVASPQTTSGDMVTDININSGESSVVQNIEGDTTFHGPVTLHNASQSYNDNVNSFNTNQDAPVSRDEFIRFDNARRIEQLTSTLQQATHPVAIAALKAQIDHFQRRR